jgi:hypothetical protein
MNEPRIQFYINCASVSCPELLNEAFTESKLEKQLVCYQKITDKSKNSITPNKIEVSKYLIGFAADFKTKGCNRFLNLYSTIKSVQMQKISYKYYNWNLND